MNIKENYKREMDNIRHRKSTDVKILDVVDMSKQEKKSSMGWKVAAAALVCVAIISMNFDSVVSYANTVIAKFGLIMGNEEVKLAEMTPIEVAVDKHIAYDKTEMLGSASYWCEYENQELLRENTGIIISESENLEIKNIMVDINTAYRVGHLSLKIYCDAEQYRMNGMFVMPGHEQEEYGYGETNKAHYVYEYADGKRAYFVKDEESDNMQRVYFTERGIMYQLFVEASKEGKNSGMKIVDYMCE